MMWWRYSRELPSLLSTGSVSWTQQMLPQSKASADRLACVWQSWPAAYLPHCRQLDLQSGGGIHSVAGSLWPWSVQQSNVLVNRFSLLRGWGSRSGQTFCLCHCNCPTSCTNQWLLASDKRSLKTYPLPASQEHPKRAACHFLQPPLWMTTMGAGCSTTPNASVLPAQKREKVSSTYLQ